jgi:hypothetical protein
MSTISASTTSTTAYKVTADTTGTLVLQTGASPTTALTLGTSQQSTFAGRVYVGAVSSALANENILTGGQGGGIQLIRNASGSPTTGQSLGSFAWKGSDSANTNAAAEAMIEAVAAENQSGSTAATNLLFYTKPAGTGPGSSPTLQLTLTSAGALYSNAGQISVAGAGGRGVDINGQGAGSIKIGADGSTYATSIMFYNNYASMVTPLTGIYAYGASGTLNWLGLGGTSYDTCSIFLPPNGNVALGTTTANARLTVTNVDAVNPTIIAQNSSAASSGVYTFYSSLGTGNAGNTNCAHLRAVTQNVAIYNLYGNGTSSFTSDARLKKNIETARDGYAEDLCKLRVVKYQWSANDDDSVKEMGLIAQEVEQVFPGLVNTTSDTIGDVENAKELKFSVLPFMLLKALQEQQAVIEQLKADVATLKGAA